MTAMNSERPNIVLVLTDQQRRDSLPCYGNCFTVAPGADAMAARGICLDAAYTPWPVCTPARGSMWTGVYPHAHGLIDNLYGVDDAFASHCRQYRTVWSMLQDTGYRTAHFGKWHLGEAHPPFFDVWHESFNSRKGHWIDGLPEGEYRPDRATDAALAFIDMQKNADRPFAMALSFYPPHDPYTAPARFYDPYRGRGVPFAGYYAAVSALDHCLDRVRTALADTRLAENTVLIFFSDHGDTFRYRPEGEHKFVCHDDAIRIPFIAEGPGIAPGRRCAAPVGLQDLTPTILDIAGANVPGGLHGRSILPLLRGRDAPDWPQAGYVQNITHVSAIHQRALRSEGWKLILSATGDHELYDLAADPEEVLNIFLTPRADAGFDRFSHYPDQARIIEGLLSQMVAEAARIADNEGAAMVATARTSLAPRLAALSV